MLHVGESIVLGDERVDATKSAYGARALHRFADQRKERRTARGAQTTQLTRRSDVEALKKNVDGNDDDGDDDEGRNGESDDDETADAGDGDGDESLKGIGENSVDDVDVLRETSDDATERGDVEEDERKAKDALDETTVDRRRRVARRTSEKKAVDEEKEAAEDGGRAIDKSVQRLVVVLRSATQIN